MQAAGTGSFTHNMLTLHMGVSTDQVTPCNTAHTIFLTICIPEKKTPNYWMISNLLALADETGHIRQAWHFQPSVKSSKAS